MGLNGLHLQHITAPLICSWICCGDSDVLTLCCRQLVRMEREVRVSDPGSIRRASSEDINEA